MLWGLHSGGWMSGLTAGAADKYRAQIELLAANDLHATGWGARELLELAPGRREEIAGWLEEHDLHVCLGIGFDFLSEDDDEIRRGTDRALEAVETLAPGMRTPVCSTGIRRDYHHYSRDYPVAKQLDRLSETMAPLAKACASAGCPLAVHTVTHFGSDLAELCSRVPGLGILLDTANCFLIGEPPLLAAEACAPYTLATHFKDHYVTPSFDPLGIRARGAVPGQGDASLRETYRLLLDKAPTPDKLVMELEIDPIWDDAGKMRDQRDVLQEALAFVRRLSRENAECGVRSAE
jgi:sugar phosphate isomerase/epimerase